MCMVHNGKERVDKTIILTVLPRLFVLGILENWLKQAKLKQSLQNILKVVFILVSNLKALLIMQSGGLYNVLLKSTPQG